MIAYEFAASLGIVVLLLAGAVLRNCLIGKQVAVREQRLSLAYERARRCRLRGGSRANLFSDQ